MDHAMRSLLPKLGELQGEEYKLQRGVKRDVEFLSRELASMHAALRAVAEVPAEQLDEQIKLWTREAVDLTYNIERVVAKFWARQLKAPAAGTDGFVAKMSFRLETVDVRRQFAIDIGQFKQMIEELAERRRRYTISFSGDRLNNIKRSIEHGFEMDPSMGSLLPKLDELLKDDYKLHKSMKRDVESLCRELRSMHAVLSTVAAVPAKQLDEQDKSWTVDAMDLMNHMERAVDRFCSRWSIVADPPRTGPKGCIARMSFKLATVIARHRFVTDIRDFKQRVRVMAIRHDRNEEHVFTTNKITPVDPRLIAIYRDPEELVGLDGPVEELVKKILAEEGSTSNQQLKVASIVGSEGLGKTTLAYKVYTRLIDQFDCGAFLSVPTTPDIARLLKDMLHKINRPVEVDLRLMDVQHISELIREALKDKRYFIVLDDIWDTKIWDIIKFALIENSNGSAVLTTSRITDVAFYIGGVYELAPLSKPYSKQLFYRRLFGSENNCPPKLSEISKKVIEKCSGIPSVIISTAGLLSDKSMTLEEWHAVLESSIDCRTGRDSYTGLDAVPMQTMVTAQRASALFMDNDDLVGLDCPVEELSKILIEEGRELKVASIVGPPGVGKTALAVQVHKRLKPLFDCTALVTAVSTKPDIQKILSSILRQISKKDHDNFGSRDLRMYIDDIREALMDRRYFIVMDDIQDMLAWRVMKCALIENSCGSAVLITSRITDVGRDAGGVYTLAPLAEMYARNLFHKRVFGSEDNCQPEFAEISEKIIQKCDRIPLAIITTACLLEGKRMEEWHEVHDSNDYGIGRDSNGMRSILALSYTGLPPHLRSCLLYLSMFQKGYEVSVDRLIWGWIAEGFVAERDGMTTREVGEHYLSELINRNLIVPMDTSAGGKALSCCVYDMVHEMIISLSTKENFLMVSDGRQGRFWPGTVERLSIQGNNTLPKPVGLSDVRSLAVFSDANLIPPLSEFQGLRVLDLGGCGGALQDDHLKGIENSFFLKYLVIGGECITAIPKEIGALSFLQTLDLRATSVKELPESIVRARQLKCLRVNSRTKIPYGIGKVEGLEELGDIDISNPELVKELYGLTNLMVLGIAIWSWDDSYNYDPLLAYLGSLTLRGQNIKSISILTCCSLHFMGKLDGGWAPPSLEKLEIRDGMFLTLPGGWISSLENLCSLSIEVQKLSQDIIDVLGKLPSLCSLSLTSKHAPEPEGRFGKCTDAFGNLTGFHLVSNTMGNMFQAGGLPMLERLKLSFEASRTKDVSPEFNFGLEHLPSTLEHLRVEINCFNASLELVEKAEAAIGKQIKRGRCHQAILEIQRLREEDMVDNENEEAEDVREAVRRKWTSLTYNQRARR